MSIIGSIKVGIAVYFAIKAWQFVAFMVGCYAQAWRDWRAPPKPALRSEGPSDDWFAQPYSSSREYKG